MKGNVKTETVSFWRNWIKIAQSPAILMHCQDRRSLILIVMQLDVQEYTMHPFLPLFLLSSPD